ncbi:hypothetical protein CC1G_02857 [Coprinopsis cinerea okayama7|uniref:Bys1 family protein n=1 Tax=Coprinopsis cinerea (strain Okayama-7 / 130 / ATCC MYA-4618 / FGSC 9003) TaxID=240176 RepID=A8N088_COPC7|nr:hypothetical protein CC1G_02857 [Coprinopsis cinerea okayama7\|eukprot:XP_001828276.2 hypothetical protein CC1G_02857 [Coprinopsis cinerea okayama7\
MFTKLSTLTALFAAAPAALAQTYTVTNNCPGPIELMLRNNSEGILQHGDSVVKDGLGTSAGFFYTSTNGAYNDQGHLVASRAGFYFEPNYWYYYLVRSEGHLNTGISITPDQPEHDGFCAVARCDDIDCPTAFPTPPTFGSPVPPPATNPAPKPPLYQCKVPGANFLITFCPSGEWPASS